MPPWTNLLAFALVAAAVIAVPGPSVVFIVGRALSAGRRAAMLTVVGNAAGVMVLVALVAAGLGVVLARSVTAYTVVKLAGAAWLAWLGIRAWRAAGRDPDPGAARPGEVGGPERGEHERGGHEGDVHDPGDGRGAVTPARALRDGLVVGASNPKLAVFLVALLPQYVAGSAPVAAQVLVLGLVFVAIALVLDSCWALAAGSARGVLAPAGGRIRFVRRAGAVMLLGLGVSLAVSGRFEASS